LGSELENEASETLGPHYRSVSLQDRVVTARLSATKAIRSDRNVKWVFSAEDFCPNLEQTEPFAREKNEPSEVVAIYNFELDRTHPSETISPMDKPNLHRIGPATSPREACTVSADSKYEKNLVVLTSSKNVWSSMDRRGVSPLGLAYSQ
jgi:hypothetical protein